MSPSRIPRKTRTAVVKHAAGLCSCGNPGQEVDHVLSLGLGGTHDMDNLVLLCRPCHRAKTNIDIGRMAKADRIRAKREGTKAPSRRPLNWSRWKRKVSGKVVPR